MTDSKICLTSPSACCAVGMYADVSGAAQAFQYDTAALHQLGGVSLVPLAPQPAAAGAHSRVCLKVGLE